MGETSAKRMRGGEMDDVIFGGSANRPARNIAEVCLWLDNSQRQVPAQFNDLELLLVVELGGDLALAVVEPQADLGDVARRPVGAAAEDDVVHLAAAHPLGR